MTLGGFQVPEGSETRLFSCTVRAIRTSDEASHSRYERVQPGKSHLRPNDLLKHSWGPLSPALKSSACDALFGAACRLSRRPANERLRRPRVVHTRTAAAMMPSMHSVFASAYA